ncbi:Aspartic protease 8, partial [Globisporangium splendens]
MQVAWLLLLALSAGNSGVQAATSSSSIMQQKLYGLASGLAYYMQVNIGQPLYATSTASTATNQFNLLVDTGSANTAVVTADCCSLTNTALYSCSASSTCVTKSTSVSVSYITGAWSGDLVQDTFSGDGLGIIESMPFTEITEQSNFIQSGYDGIVGLGYKSIASPSSNPPTPYFDIIQSVRNLPNVFSLLMCGSLQALALPNSTLNTEEDLYAGEFIMGSTEGTSGQRYYKDDLVYTPLVHEKWFNVIVTDIKVSGTSLGLDCKEINTPRSIVDSGTSNMAFPSAVYSAVVSQLKTNVRKIIPSAPDSFFNDDVPCCSTLCDPTNASSALYTLPALSISLAIDGGKEQITISVPPEYIWRPLLVSTTSGVRACRVFGISESDITLLGDVFMDGLFTVHDRKSSQLGFGVASSCPNGVTSSKTVTKESLSSVDNFCDCVSSSDRKSSLLSSYWPVGSGKPCFFWQWWMYIVIVSIVLIIIALIAVFYISWRRRKLLKELHQIRSDNQRAVDRQLSNGLDQNLLTPSSKDGTPTAALPILIHSVSHENLNRINSSSIRSISSSNGGYEPPPTPLVLSSGKTNDSRSSSSASLSAKETTTLEPAAHHNRAEESV